LRKREKRRISDKGKVEDEYIIANAIKRGRLAHQADTGKEFSSNMETQHPNLTYREGSGANIEEEI